VESLKEMLIRHEGKRYKPYYCSGKRLTIGIGHNISDNGLPKDIKMYLNKNGRITEEMVEILYQIDLEIAIHGCLRLYPKFKTFTEGRRNALINFLFNVGIGTAKTFVNTNRYINNGFWEQASLNMKKSKWFKQVKSRGVEIVNLIKGDS